jgi:hypothetical protein
VSLLAKKALIKLKVTRMFGTINKIVGQEVKGVKIKVKVVEVEAIRAKTSYIRTRTRSKRTILKTSY